MSKVLSDVQSSAEAAAHGEDEQLDLLDAAIVIAKHKRSIGRFTLMAIAVAALVVFLVPAKYTATARVLPPQQNQNSAAMLLSQLSGLPGGGSGSAISSGIGGALGLKSPSDLYVAILKSQTIENAIIRKYELMKAYRDRTLSEAREDLEKHENIIVGKEGVITIEFEDRVPTRAAQIANDLVSSLDQLVQSIAITDAGQRRLFYSREILKSKDDLTKAELEFKKMQQATGIIVPQQAQALIENIAKLRGLIMAKEVEVSAMRTFATDRNPQLLQLENEINGMNLQLQKLEKNQPVVEGDVMVPTGRIPDAALEYLRKYRDLKSNEMLYELLRKQFALAKIDEAKDAPLVQVLDVAYTPDRRSSPKRMFIVALSGLCALMFSTLWAFLREKHDRDKGDPEYSVKVQQFNQHLPMLFRFRG